jgi:hypothetical protein
MENTARMNFIANLVEAGELKPVIDRSFPLERIADAFKYGRAAARRFSSALFADRRLIGWPYAAEVAPTLLGDADVLGSWTLRSLPALECDGLSFA